MRLRSRDCFWPLAVSPLTNGWDQAASRRSATTYRMRWAEMKDLHRLNFETYAEGEMTLGDYLDRVVSHRERPFTNSAYRLREFKLDALADTLPSASSKPVSSRPTCSRLLWTSLKRQPSRRLSAATAAVISTDTSRVTVRVIRTDEDLMIARSV